MATNDGRQGSGSAGAGAEVLDAPSYAEVEIVFANDISEVEAAGGAWQEGVISAISANVGIPASRIEIAEIVPGSIRVIFRFLEDLTGDEDALSADDAVGALDEQLDTQTGVYNDASFSENYLSHEVSLI